MKQVEQASLGPAANADTPHAAVDRRIRFVTLDAMRGVAALVVIAFHYAAHYQGLDPGFGYLAVDVFFVISGLVLAGPYDRMLSAGASILDMMRWRIWRLGPLYALGLILGVASILVSPEPAIRGGALWGALLFNAFGLPSPWVGISNQAFFPINLPFWSLFFELWVANLLLAVFWKRLSMRWIVAILVVSAIGLIAIEKFSYRLNMGYTWPTIGTGIARVGYSFFAGVLLAKLPRSWKPSFAIPSWLCLIVLAVLLALPLTDRLGHIYELACVLVAFPALVFFGAGAIEKRPALGRFFGDISYSAYAIHYPLLTLFLLLPIPRGIPGQVGFVAVVCALAWLAAKADTNLRSLRKAVSEPLASGSA